VAGGRAPRQLTILASAPANRRATSLRFHCLRACDVTLGAASERAGLDAYLRANTVKRRTHSLFRQGTYWYGCIPTMRDAWFDRLMAAYVDILQEHRDMFEIVGAI
jgi:hypothetical protein